MSMACRAPMDGYTRRHIVSQTAIDRVRELVPQVAHRSDTDVGNAIDRSVVDAMKLDGHLEQWNDTRGDSSRRTIWSLELEGHLFFDAEKDRRFYALLRTPEEGQPEQKVVMTIIPREFYVNNVESGRWVRPSTRRTRRGDSSASPQPTLGHKPFAGLEGVKVVQPQIESTPVYAAPMETGSKKEDFMIDPSQGEPDDEPDEEDLEESDYLVTVGDPGTNRFEATVVDQDQLAEHIGGLVLRGRPADTIAVWQRTSIRPRVTVTLDGE